MRNSLFDPTVCDSNLGDDPDEHPPLGLTQFPLNLDMKEGYILLKTKNLTTFAGCANRPKVS